MPIDSTRPYSMKAKFDNEGKIGPKIYMYKDAPGNYYDAHGKEVPAPVAKMAGFDIDSMERQKSLVMDKHRLQKLHDEMTGPKPLHVITETRPNGHTMIKVGPDLYHIEDMDRNRITSAPMSRYYAKIWLDDIDPYAEGEEPSLGDELRKVVVDDDEEAPLSYSEVPEFGGPEGDQGGVVEVTDDPEPPLVFKRAKKSEE